MAAGIASGFVRKLYRILDQESDSIVAWDASGLSFSIHDSKKLNDTVLPRYFRGRMSAFRQQLLDHGFEQLECEDNETRECYAHSHFLRGCPDRLSYIVRVPKPKMKAGASLPAHTQPQPHPQQQSFHQTAANGHHHQQHHQQHQQQHQRPPSSLGIHIAPTVVGGGRAPLTVTLTTGKRSSPVHSAQEDAVHKRLRATAASPVHSPTSRPLLRTTGAPVPAPPVPANLSRNPLFSNESSTDGLDVARVFSMSRISDSGLFPNSTDLPEPISYLNKILHTKMSASMAPLSAASIAAAPSSSTSSVSSTTATPPPIDTPVFSEDMMRSALYFLVSTSTTGVGPDQQQHHGPDHPAHDSDAWAAHVQRLSTSGFLSSLMMSSATGRDAGQGGLSSAAGSAWGPAAAVNPLFSQSSEQDDDEEDSIWNLLLTSSIDRVKSAIQEVVSPQERLRLILEERERLEEQRKRIYGLASENDHTQQQQQAAPPATSAASTAAFSSTSGPHKPTETQTAKPLKSALKKPSPTNERPPPPPPPTSHRLFSRAKQPAKNPLFTGGGSAKPPVPNPLFANPSSTQAAAASNPLFANDNGDDASDGDAGDCSSGSANPLFAKSTASRRREPVNPLFGKPSSSSASSSSLPSSSAIAAAAAAARPLPSANASNPAEDGLWRLLMTSSVDWFRKGAAEFDELDL